LYFCQMYFSTFLSCVPDSSSAHLPLVFLANIGTDVSCHAVYIFCPCFLLSLCVGLWVISMKFHIPHFLALVEEVNIMRELTDQNLKQVEYELIKY
jgi:hypothetical protein